MTVRAAAKASNMVSVGGKHGHHTHGMLDLQPQSVVH